MNLLIFQLIFLTTFQGQQTQGPTKYVAESVSCSGSWTGLT